MHPDRSRFRQDIWLIENGQLARRAVRHEVADLAHVRFARLAHQKAGISLKSGKEALVQARISKRLRALDLPGPASTSTAAA